MAHPDPAVERARVAYAALDAARNQVGEAARSWREAVAAVVAAEARERGERGSRKRAADRLGISAIAVSRALAN